MPRSTAGSRGDPERARAGFKLSIGPGAGRQGDAQLKPVGLQCRHQRPQIRRQGTQGAGLQLARGKEHRGQHHRHHGASAGRQARMINPIA